VENCAACCFLSRSSTTNELLLSIFDGITTEKALRPEENTMTFTPFRHGIEFQNGNFCTAPEDSPLNGCTAKRQFFRAISPFGAIFAHNLPFLARDRLGCPFTYVRAPSSLSPHPQPSFTPLFLPRPSLPAPRSVRKKTTTAHSPQKRRKGGSEEV
jgi:hypothetical protein